MPRWILSGLIALFLSVFAGALAQVPTPVSTEAAAPAATDEPALAPRHGAWTEILQNYVVPAEDGVNRFDYGALQSNDADRAALRAYIAGFESLEFDTLTRDEAFAAWANLYNALTIEHMIGRYPVRSIRSGYFVGPWKEVKTIADGREVSLDDIEHKILRVEWSDPRVHYAVNCASIGCPNLQSRAWEADTLDEALNAAAAEFVNHPRGVSVRARGGLEVSTIYRWFREDFGDSEAGVIAHLLEHANEDTRAAIEANRDIRKHAYDWDLNDVE